MLRTGLRAILFGGAVGALLSLLRAPLGYDPLHIMAVPARAGLGVRAAALFAVALAIACSGPLLDRKRPPLAEILVGAACGFAVHAWYAALTPPALGALLLRGALCLGLAIALGASGRRAATAEAPGSATRSARIGTATGFALCGAGSTIAVEAIARHLRLLTTGSLLDESVTASVFLAGTAIGALAFAPLFGARTRIAAACLGALAGALGCWIALRTFGVIGSPAGFNGYLRQYGLRPSMRGRLEYLALLGGTTLLLPAFGVGLSLASARRRELVALLGGAALGLFLVPRLLGGTDLAEPLAPSPFSAGLVRVGILLGGAGAVIVLLAQGSSLRARPLFLLIASAGTAAGFVLPIRPLVMLSPWRVEPAAARVVVDHPDGLLTVEAHGGIDHVTLDRRTITPPRERTGLDARALETTFALLPQSRREAPRVLLLGVLTPGRAIAFAAHGTASVDRTASFHAVQPALEEALFAAVGATLPAGDVLAPAEARRRLGEGRYELVVALPVGGEPAPLLAIEELAARAPGTTIVLWSDAGGALAALRPTARDEVVALVADGLENVAFAVVRGTGHEVARHGVDVPELGSEVRLFPFGRSVSAPASGSWLRTRDFRKRWTCLERLAARLERSAAGEPAERLMRGFARTIAAQRESSPFAEDEADAEIDEAALADVCAGAGERVPDAFSKRLVEDLARILLAKRRLADIAAHVEPLARRFAPWPELERVLIEADVEGLLGAEALARIAALGGAHDAELRLLEARAHGVAGDRTREVRALFALMSGESGRTRIRPHLERALLTLDAQPRGALLAEARAAFGPAEWLDDLEHRLAGGSEHDRSGAHDH